MGSLLAYSGITTKVRAMYSRLLTNEDFRNMASLDTVAEAVEFLKRRPSYAGIFQNLEESSLHRGKIEQLLTLSQYDDFARLYRFSNLTQRKFLDLYFMRYEIAILKKCLRNALDHHSLELDLSAFQEFFERHSQLDLKRLSTSQNLQEFILNLENSPYCSSLSLIDENDRPSLFNCEMRLDLLYFKTVWSVRKKYLTKREQAVLTKCFGSNLDLLNIQWIYRSKKYYRLSPAEIYALLIPVDYRLKKEELTRMVESNSAAELLEAFRTTYYGRFDIGEVPVHPKLEDLYEKIMCRIYADTSRREPYSIAILNSYLYFKELEIQKIITTIESIRYGLDTAEIISYVVKE